MSQQLTLATNRPLSYLWTLHQRCSNTAAAALPMIPTDVIIKLCDHHFKVSSKVLCQSSRYFDALIRFQMSDRMKNVSETSEIEIVENNQDAFKTILNKLSDLNETNSIMTTANNSNVVAATNSASNIAHQHQYYHQHQQQCQHDSLDFLFDCVIVCSKYFFDCLERLYSDEFVNKLRHDASDCAVTDKILPPQFKTNAELISQNNKNNNNNNNTWLSMLEMHRLAKVYNLEYLSCEIRDLIREKRAFFLKRLRNTYYFW